MQKGAGGFQNVEDKISLGEKKKPTAARIQKRLTSEQKAEQVRRVKAGLSPYDDDDPSIGGGGIPVSQAPDSLTATRTPQAQDMIERGEAQRKLDKLKKEQEQNQMFIDMANTDDNKVRAAANTKRRDQLRNQQTSGEKLLTGAEQEELRQLSPERTEVEEAMNTAFFGEGSAGAGIVSGAGYRAGKSTDQFIDNASQQGYLEERLAKPKVKTPRLDDSITRDMAALREEQARQGVGDGPIDVTKQIGFNKYNDPKDIAAKQRAEGIAKYKASVPTKTVTDNMGKTRTQKTGYGDESLLNKPGMMASSQQTLASQQGVNVQDLRGKEGTYRMGIEGDRAAKKEVSDAIEQKRVAAEQAKKDKDKKDYDARVAHAAADSGVDGMTNAELKRKQYADKQDRKKDALRQVRSGKLKPKNVQDFLNQTGNFTKEKEAERKAKQEAANATKIQRSGNVGGMGAGQGGGKPPGMSDAAWNGMMSTSHYGPQKPKQTATTLGEASSFYANQLTGGGAAGGPVNSEMNSGQTPTGGYRGGVPNTGPAGAAPGAGGVAGLPGPQGMAGAGGAAGGIMGPDAITAMNSLATALNGIADGIKIQDINVTLDQGNIMETIKNVVTDAVVAEISKLPGTGGSSDKGTLSSSNPPANTNGGQ